MFCLSTGSLCLFGLNRIFEIAKETGFGGLEVVLSESYDTYDAAYLQKLSTEHNLPIVSLKVPSFMNTIPRIELAIKLADQLKVPTVVVCSPLFTDFRFTQWFKTELPKIQKNVSFKIAVENVPAEGGSFIPKYALRNIEDLRRFDWLCLDTSYLVTQRLNLLKVYGVIHKRLALVHISNYNDNKHHQLLGEGIVPLESFLTKIKADKFDAPIILKLTPEALGGNDLEKVKENLKKSITFYEKYFVNA
jgi:sugar phosphate isomerase/epimerase